MLATQVPTPNIQSVRDPPEGLQLGLPDHLYPILYAHQFGDKPACIERFGRKLAVWRDKSGPVSGPRHRR